jgi:hypothetical protein
VEASQQVPASQNVDKDNQHLKVPNAEEKL